MLKYLNLQCHQTLCIEIMNWFWKYIASYRVFQHQPLYLCESHFSLKVYFSANARCSRNYYACGKKPTAYLWFRPTRLCSGRLSAVDLRYDPLWVCNRNKCRRNTVVERGPLVPKVPGSHPVLSGFCLLHLGFIFSNRTSTVFLAWRFSPWS